MQPSQFFHVLTVLVSSRQDLGRLAEEIAMRCRKEAGGRIHAALGKMTTPEARGYIRARTGDLLQEQMARFAPRAALNWYGEEELAHHAMNALVTMVLRDWLAARSAQPARRAA